MNPLKRRAILHLGAEKTGSTTIQKFLDLNSEGLGKWGVAFCASMGRPNNRKLCLYGMDCDRLTQLHKVFGLFDQGDREAFVTNQKEEFRREMEGIPNEIHTVIFSNEHMRSNLVFEHEVRRIQDLLLPYFDDIIILVYLRRQVDLAVSHYSSFLRAGRDRQAVLPQIDENAGFFNYLTTLNLWGKVFGQEAVQLRIFDEREFFRHDLLEDFLHCCGLPDALNFRPVDKHNRSLRPVAQEFLRSLNRHFPNSKETPVHPYRFLAAKYLEKEFSGTGRRPERTAAEAFQRMFHASNEVIRHRWFPDRKVLFDDDFSDFPETDDIDTTFDEAVDIAAPILRRMIDEAHHLQAEIYYRDGVIAQLQGNADQAREHFVAALALVPDHQLARLALNRLRMDE